SCTYGNLSRCSMQNGLRSVVGRPQPTMWQNSRAGTGRRPERRARRRSSVERRPDLLRLMILFAPPFQVPATTRQIACRREAIPRNRWGTRHVPQSGQAPVESFSKGPCTLVNVPSNGPFDGVNGGLDPNLPRSARDAGASTHVRFARHGGG